MKKVEAWWPHGSDSGMSSLGSSLGQGIFCCVLERGQCLASLNPGVQMGTAEFNAGSNPAMD